ncbi:Hydroxymethylpyrimidine phosphate kinase ThiD [Candidatus Syntrophocurvum alkaliphilum]|uniref:Hydroxymethylpyrimidine/phosphomethylpyrimidine kinase n=2 Tax=Candidatus Syntrophocurvum alkaliphilum TaxID=2293317 RepID=A0A6I6DBX9_9FIRM|nr:Hydroxymethylpyrimidine phosphate kinase ThiD [Candidatus Syntrophocurvum alkaliphilum]
MKCVLTIAGSDSCAGAGIQADLKTISALGAYGLTVITAVTAQNTKGVIKVQEINPDIVEAQLEALFSDINIDVVKIGMLSSKVLIEKVASYLKAKSYNNNLPIILDPVMVAKSGDRLLHVEAIEALKNKLFPISKIITPNIPEAETLLNTRINNINDMDAACLKLLDYGCEWAIVKGGHLDGEPVDVVGNNNKTYHISSKRINTNNSHGTGCSFSSAIAVNLANNLDVIDSVTKAKKYISTSLKTGFPIGKGVGILDHFCLSTIRKGELQ